MSKLGKTPAKVKSTLDLALAYLAKHPTRYLFPIRKLAKSPPLFADNLNLASNDPKQIAEWTKKFPGSNWGVALRKSGIIVADVDRKSGKVGQATYDALKKKYGWPVTETVSTPSGGLHRYYVGEHVFALGDHGFGPDIDSPNYVLIPGCVLADGTSYRDIGNRPAAAAPEWFGELLKLRPPHEAASVVPVVDFDQPANVEWAEHYLTVDAKPAIEGETGDQTTIDVATDLKDHGISEPKCLDLMLTFYNERCNPPWPVEGDKSISKKVANAYLYKRELSPGELTAEADFKDDPPPLVPELSPDDLGVKPDAPDAKFPDPISLKDLATKVFPPRVDVVEGLILPGIVQTIDGDGGVGKSTVMAQISVAVAAGKPIFGRDTDQRGVWFISHEDEERDLQSVMLAMAKELEVTPSDAPVEVSSLLDYDIAIADIDDTGKIKPLAFCRYLEAELATRRGSLVVIDCLADIARMAEAGRLAPNAFFKTVMTGLCRKYGVTIIITAHPSKASMVDGSWSSGSTAYRTALRNKLVMKLVERGDIYGPRTLETLKKNWGKPSPPLTLTWQQGVFILDREDVTGVQKYRIVIRKILELIETGVTVARTNQSDAAYTPKSLATDLHDSEGGRLVTGKDVSAFMRRAEADGVLKYVTGTRTTKAHYVRGDNAGDFNAEVDAEA
jgi:hypothetical protein